MKQLSLTSGAQLGSQTSIHYAGGHEAWSSRFESAQVTQYFYLVM